MDNRVLERIVIVILLLLDVFLLGVLLSDRIESRRSDSETAERLTALLEEKGITVAEDAVTVQDAPPSMTLLRSAAQEAEIVDRLLKKPVQEDLGGNIMFYRSDEGQAVFRGSGEVAALFTPGSIPLRGGAEKTSERLLRRINMEYERFSVGENPDETPYTEYYACRDGYPVFNAILRFDYSEDCLYMLTGTRLFDSSVAAEESELFNSASVLMRFAELAERGEIACSRLESCRPGYLLSVLVSGEGTLLPVWRLETDTGVYLINAETGRLESGAV